MNVSTADVVRAAIVLLEHGHEREALTCLNSVHAPSNHMAGDYYLAMANCYRNLGDFPQALNSFNTGIQFDPGSQQLKFGRALLNLTLGRWRDGWPEYEIRKHLQSANGEGRGFNFHELAIDDIEHPVFIYGEQGLGDEIMFASTIQTVFGERPRVIECAPQLVKLFRRSFACDVVERNTSRDPRQFKEVASFGCPMRELASGSIPLWASQSNLDWFNHKPFLCANLELRNVWRNKLGADDGEHVIGISWRGGTKFTRRAARSMALDDFVRHVRAIYPDSQLVSLQHDAGAEHNAQVYQPQFNEAFGDLDQTAALIASCDLVMSVCNTNVHLAGALGVPCRVFAPYVPEWRYGMNGLMSWYPNVAIHRQKIPGDWASAFT